MPNIKSAMKRVRVTAKKSQANKITKSSIRTSIKKTKSAIENSDEKVKEIANDTVAMIDRAVSKGYIHKNNAARKKSQIAKALNKAQ